MTEIVNNGFHPFSTERAEVFMLVHKLIVGCVVLNVIERVDDPIYPPAARADIRQ
jgi:hypothetical protein